MEILYCNSLLLYQYRNSPWMVYFTRIFAFLLLWLSLYNQLLLFLLIRLQRETERSRKKRYEMREKIKNLCSENEAAASEVKRFNRRATRRPSKEVNQPEVLSTIVIVAEASSYINNRRRYEHLRSVKTLDHFHSELTRPGFNLSRSASYLKLSPRRTDSREGKRHVQTDKVKLVRP